MTNSLMFVKMCCDSRLAPIKVITLKTQLHAANARWKRLSQRNWNNHKSLYSLPGILQYNIQSNSVVTNSSGPAKFIRYNRGSL